MNTVTIAGNLAKEPDIKFAETGNSITEITVVFNDRRYNKDTNKREDGKPNFFDVVAFGKLADHVAANLMKGQRVIVTGKLEQQTWVTKEGDKRSKIKIKADEIGNSYKWGPPKTADSAPTAKPAPADHDVF